MRFLSYVLMYLCMSTFILAQTTVSGTVEAYIYEEKSTDQKVLRPWNFGDVLVNGELTQTDQNGDYSIVIEDALVTVSAGPLKARHLIVMDNMGSELNFDSTPTEATTIDWVWNDTSTVAGDDTEANVWYHITKMYDLLEDQQGIYRWDLMDYFGGDTITATVRKEALSGNNCNAAYTAGNLEFGLPRPDTCLSPALDTDVIYHEYGHAIFRSFYTGQLGGANTELLAMNEGFSDYWAAIQNDDSQINEGWVLDSSAFGVPAVIRNLDNNLTYTDDFDSLGFTHENGQIIGGALWDMRQALPNDAADDIFFRTYFKRDSSFEDYFNSILVTNDSIFGNDNGVADTSDQYINEILYAFGDHKVYADSAPPASPRNVQVVGNKDNHPYITWENNGEAFVANDLHKKKGSGSWETIELGSATSYEDTAEVVVGTPQANEETVYYKVQTLSQTNFKFSSFSETVDIVVEGDPQTKAGSGPKESTRIVEIFNLQQNYPNPFNPSTTIRFSLPEAAQASLVIFDVQGRKVDVLMDENLSAGTHSHTWQADNLPSGIYFYTLTAGTKNETKRMLLMK